MRTPTIRRQSENHFGAWGLDAPRGDEKQPACAAPGVDPEYFWPLSDSDLYAITQAKKVCGRCPIKKRCLNHALENEPYGLWGGHTEEERKALAKKRAHKHARCRACEYTHPIATLTDGMCADCQAAGCGTWRGYDQHLLLKTRVCDPCRDSRTASDRAALAKRKTAVR